MGKFWKEIVGGQVQQGVYQAGPRHASRQYGSFKTGRPPRLPFQFVTFFELNNIHGGADNPGLIMPDDQYQFSSLVRAIDMPSVDLTVEKRNQYNKLKPVILTKNFKPFSMTVYDDIESRWFGLWQHYYNYHFMDGRRPMNARGKKDGYSDISLHDDVVATAETSSKGPFNSDVAGPDIHSNKMRNYFKAIHVFQIHGEYVTRTTAYNPVLTSAESTQLDYASSGVPSEITFNIEYEKLEYGPKLNFGYKDEKIPGLDSTHLETLLEDVTKSTPFNPTQDKIKGLVQGFLGLEQSNITTTENQLHNANRDLQQKATQPGALIVSDKSGTTGRGFFSSLIGNALNKKIDEATGDLFKKQNKNLNKLNFF
ncbi:hypothetical protein N9H30_00610 [bacterium]|nr:hypothetical protein [bacterium]